VPYLADDDVFIVKESEKFFSVRISSFTTRYWVEVIPIAFRLEIPSNYGEFGEHFFAAVEIIFI
jgi:hypothetical protein